MILLRNVTHVANAALDRELDFAVLVPTCRDEDVPANPFPASRLLVDLTTTSKSVSNCSLDVATRLSCCIILRIMQQLPEFVAAPAGVKGVVLQRKVLG